jgi:flagellar biosynthesis protein FliP
MNRFRKNVVPFFLILKCFHPTVIIILTCMLQDMEEKSWPPAVLSGVGKFLYNIIMRDIKIDVNIAKVSSKTE